MGATYYPNLLDMLPLCDFVMVACPLTDDTSKLFGEKQFEAMKSSAHFINVARGESFVIFK